MTIEPMTPPPIDEENQAVPHRNYLFMGLASLLAVAAVMYVRSDGSGLAAIIPSLIGATGFLLHLRFAPGLFVLAMSYFIVMPYGIIAGPSLSSDVYGSAFHIMDILLAVAILSALISMIRYLSMKSLAMPSDVSRSVARKSRIRRMRPDAIVPQDEFVQLFIGIGIFVLVGQILWLIVTSLHVEVLRLPPFSVKWDAFLELTPLDPRGRASSPLDRFLILVGLAGFLALTFSTVSWYWKLSRLSKIEAHMTLLDTGWRESRRELNRQAKWTAWSDGRNRGIQQREPRQPYSRRTAIGCLVLGMLVGLFILIIYIRFGDVILSKIRS